ncbi:MAG TPA: hypothetical protein VF735_13485 [Pyrinomonadaceae bacterium]|jgi:hypothetical protein
MVNTELRRVKTLRLSAPTGSSLRRGRVLTEDALRTASLPGPIGGRVLVVRSLKLGNIRSDQSAASVALAIERSLYNLGSQPVHAEDPSASLSPFVYFRDEVEPYVCLALRLARGQSATEWFWPLAVSFWRPAMASDEALRSLLGATLQTQAGVAAAVSLVRELFECEASAPLLAALRPQEGPALLKACGWSSASLSHSLLETTVAESVRQTLPRWGSRLASWINRWGTDDARSSWLAATALAADKPARLQDQRLMSYALQIIKLVTQSVQQRQHTAEPNRLTGKEITPQAETPPLLAEDEAFKLNSSQTSKPTDSLPLVTGESQGFARPDFEDHRAIEDESDAILQERRVLQEVSRESPDEAASLLKSFSTASTEGARQATSPALAHSEDRQSTFESAERPEEFPQGFPQPTACAGLFFLIPVLTRLGFSRMLDANPHLIEYSLPERFLSFAGERLGIPGDDSALSPLTAAVRRAEPVPSQCEFAVPSIWLEGLCRRGPLVVCRTPDEPHRRALCDSSENLTLALWRGGAPENVRALIGDARLRRSLSPGVNDLQLLLESWLIAARRWCRRFARIGLRELVCRAGHVSHTRTHIDVFLDHRQSDVRVRRAGLDINPGWVVWLGRVLTFYYLYGEQGDVC